VIDWKVVSAAAAVRQQSEISTTCATPQYRASRSLASTLTASFAHLGAPDSSQYSARPMFTPCPAKYTTSWSTVPGASIAPIACWIWPTVTAPASSVRMVTEEKPGACVQAAIRAIPGVTACSDGISPVWLTPMSTAARCMPADSSTSTRLLRRATRR
jgi:hypothetical protein